MNNRPLVPSQLREIVAYMLVHCKIIQTCCNVIPTLLQLNSNNSSSCGLFIYVAVAEYGGISRDFAEYGGIEWSSIASNFSEIRPTCAELICSEAGAGAPK